MKKIYEKLFNSLTRRKKLNKTFTFQHKKEKIMATVMEKDVLIELVAYAQADLSKKLPLPLNEDQNKLANLRSKIYSTPYQELDYENLCKEVQRIRNTYN